MILLGIIAASCRGSKSTGGGLDKCGIWSLEYRVSDFGDTLGVFGMSSSAIEGTLSGIDGSQTTKKPFEGSGRLFLGIVLNEGKEWPAFVMYGQSDQTEFYSKSLTPNGEYQTATMKLKAEKDSVTCENMLLTRTGGILPGTDGEAETILNILGKEQAISILVRLKTNRPLYRPDVEDFKFEITEEQMSGFERVHTNFSKKVMRP